MKKFIPVTLLLVFASLIFAAFAMSGTPPDNTTATNDLTTRAFQTYLNTLGHEYPQTGHRKYLILTEDGCMGCSRQIRDEWHGDCTARLRVFLVAILPRCLREGVGASQFFSVERTAAAATVMVAKCMGRFPEPGLVYGRLDHV